MNTSAMDRLTPQNSAVLFIDHQTGLCNGVTTQNPTEFKSNVIGLAKLARIFKLPAVITTSAENGPNGPFLPEVRALLPEAKVVARPGEINSWDNPDFVAAVKATGRKKLIIAGVSTEVCVAFVALSAFRAGYVGYAVIDASGSWNKLVEEVAIKRMVQAGVQPVTVIGVGAELQGDWRNPTAEQFGPWLGENLPFYGNLIGSFMAAKG